MYLAPSKIFQSSKVKRIISLVMFSVVSVVLFAQEQAASDNALNETTKEVFKEAKKSFGPSRETISFTVISLLVIAIIASGIYTMKKQAQARKIDAAARKAAAAARRKK